MERITIEVADDGRVTVTAESPGEDVETMDFASVDEAAGAVRELMTDAVEDAGETSGEEAQPDAAAMWDQEAATRPQNPNLMR